MTEAGKRKRFTMKGRIDARNYFLKLKLYFTKFLQCNIFE